MMRERMMMTGKSMCFLFIGWVGLGQFIKAVVQWLCALIEVNFDIFDAIHLALEDSEETIAASGPPFKDPFELEYIIHRTYVLCERGQIPNNESFGRPSQIYIRWQLRISKVM
jgi:hypothetical protein